MPFVAKRIFNWEPVTIDRSWGLETIPEGKLYPLCNSLICRVCGFLYLDMRFSDSEMEALYRGYRDESYVSERERFEPGYAARNLRIMAGRNYINDIEQFLEPYLKFPITILDWGGDTGINTPFRSRCKSHSVFDITARKMVKGAALIKKEDIAGQNYNLFVCSNVLEHVPYPSQSLAEIVEHMGPESVLYIEVPFENIVKKHGHDALIYKKHWHEHINFFSKLSLMRLVNKVGLQLLDLSDTFCASSDTSEVFLLQAVCKIKQG